MKLRSYFEARDRAYIAEKDFNKEKSEKENQKSVVRTGPTKDKRDFDYAKGNKRMKFSTPEPSNPPRKATDPCHYDTGACFKCGKIGHLIKDCPNMNKKPQERPRVQGRVFFITKQDDEASNSVIEGTLHILNTPALFISSTHQLMF